MEQIEKNGTEYYTIDLLRILKILWHRLWIIVFSGILAGAIGFSYSAFGIAPKYSSSIMLYVNNSSISLGNTNFSISSSEIIAAQSLVKTYIVLLQNRTTLEKVIEMAEIPYTYEQLNGMISAASVNDTEVFKITVTCEDPYEAAKIANCIAQVLPERVGQVIEGSSMVVVDTAIVNLQKVSPSITKYTAIGFILGVFLAVAALAVMAMMDSTIHDEEYILQTYDYPILAKIPDLVSGGTKDYGYYSKKRRYSYESSYGGR